MTSRPEFHPQAAWARPPLFLIGAARSGTTIVGDVLASHPEVAYWVEPKYVWRHGAHQSRTDARSADEATPAVRTYIRESFGTFLRRSGRAQFLEKTPSNCFRVSFINRVFPEALFLHIERDGAQVIASALQRWTTPPDDAALWRRLRRMEVPWGALHHYLPDALRELVMRRLRPRSGHLWGPRYPGIQDDVAKLGVAATCARQWVESVRCARRELAALPPRRVLAFRYEDFVAAPEAKLAEILRFAQLGPAGQMRPAVAAVHRQAGGTYASMDPQTRALVDAAVASVARETP